MRTDTILQVKRFVMRAMVFLFVFVFLDLVLGRIIRLAYFSQENKYTYCILKTKADVIIVGSSRANSHYIPSIISDTLGLSCFNAGSGGQNIYYDYCVIGSILERYKPKIIIMDVVSSDIEVEDTAIDKLSELLPFYESSQSITEMINLGGAVERMKMLSRIFPFNSKVPSIIFSFIKRNKNPNLIMGGYIPLDGVISSPLVEAERQKNVSIDSLKVNLVKKIASLCQQNDVKMLVVISPRFKKFNEKSASIEFLEDILSKYGIEVWNYEQDPYFLARGALFRDELHLNHKGAVEYSRIIANRIKQIYFTGE